MPDRSRKEIKFKIPFGTPPVKCRGCGSEIYFIPTKKRGVTMPVNQDGISHFATCPNAGEFRGKR